MPGTGGDLDDAVTAAKAGAEWALTALYRAVHPSLVRYLWSHSPGEAEDLASEVWLEVARALGRFEGDAQDFRRFVFTVARRRAIDHGRKQARRRTDPTAPGSMPVQVDRADPEHAVVESMAGEEAVARIRSMLLPEQAEVLVLRAIAGLSVAEVAEVLGRRPAAVSVIQHRALRRLADRLDAGTTVSQTRLSLVKDP